MANFGVTENTIELSEASKPSIPTGIAVLLSTLNIFLSITASLGNALILVALHKETSLHPPTKLLFRCLAITDLCVGVITHPLFAVFLFSSVTTEMNWKVIFYAEMLCTASSFVLCQVSIFTSSAISVDRLQALLSGLRYRQVVTLPRVRAVVTCFWLIGISIGSIYFWSYSIAFYVGFSFTIFSLATSVFSYSTIYFKLRQHRPQVSPLTQGQPNGRELPLNIARYKNSVSSAIWVQVALLTCYVPLSVVIMLVVYGQIPGSRSETALYVTGTFVYLNSSLNPILYCWRIRSVRQAAKDTIKQLNCCKSA
ncbi:adenosine receptor A3-like [Orbicella faveolata]|uniref:adenosine receptor A3-like n=1 Tax=Orbicella faveolata TaxID=48498 RepID=UPI0009E4E059|nr:adenosine receptor A3-like [Orbicella faveolata]